MCVYIYIHNSIYIYMCVYTHTHAYNITYHIFKVSKPMGYKNNTLFPLIQATENTSV